MIDVFTTRVYDAWIKSLRDERALARIRLRLRHITFYGHFGDTKTVGDGVSELRLHFGPGYRIYYMMQGYSCILLLAGGSKSSQDRDIKKAIALAEEFRR